MTINLQKWRFLTKDKACVCLWILHNMVENMWNIFQALEDEVLAKVEIKGKNQNFTESSSPLAKDLMENSLRGHILGGLIEIWFYVAFWRCVHTIQKKGFFFPSR